jgi:general stress protein YciG
MPQGIQFESNESQELPRAKSNRGFASMDTQKQREIASKGGKAAHQSGNAHEFTSAEAAAAGRKGGMVVSQNTQHMATIGRKGGEARGKNRRIKIADQMPEQQSA